MSEHSQNTGAKLDSRTIAIWAGTVIIVFGLLWLFFSIRGLHAQIRDERSQAEARVEQERKRSAIRLAEGMSALFAPLILNSTDGGATMKTVCEAVASKGTVELIIVTDTSGNVVATSNARFANNPIPEMATQTVTETLENGAWQVTRPVVWNNNRVGSIRIKVAF